MIYHSKEIPKVSLSKSLLQYPLWKLKVSPLPAVSHFFNSVLPHSSVSIHLHTFLSLMSFFQCQSFLPHTSFFYQFKFCPPLNPTLLLLQFSNTVWLFATNQSPFTTYSILMLFYFPSFSPLSTILQYFYRGKKNNAIALADIYPWLNRKKRLPWPCDISFFVGGKRDVSERKVLFLLATIAF